MDDRALTERQRGERHKSRSDRALSAALVPFLGYFAISLSPSSIDCSALTHCTAGDIQFLPGIRLFALSPELQMTLFSASLGGMGALWGALTGDAKNAPTPLSPPWRAAAHLLVVATGVMTGALAYFLTRTALLGPNATLAMINPTGLTVIAFAAGLGARKIVPDVIARAESILHKDVERTRFEATSHWTPPHPVDSDLANAIEQLSRRFDSALSRPTLDNWSGMVCARVHPLHRDRAPGDHAVVAGEKLIVDIDFVPDPQPMADALPVSESEGEVGDIILITGGNPDPDQISFDIVMEAPWFGMADQSAAVTFRRGDLQGRMSTRIVCDAPAEPGETELYLSIEQKGRLIQSLLLPLTVVPSPAATDGH